MRNLQTNLVNKMCITRKSCKAFQKLTQKRILAFNSIITNVRTIFLFVYLRDTESESHSSDAAMARAVISLIHRNTLLIE